MSLSSGSSLKKISFHIRHDWERMHTSEISRAH